MPNDIRYDDAIDRDRDLYFTDLEFQDRSAERDDAIAFVNAAMPAVESAAA